jgi:hypothetical protein
MVSERYGFRTRPVPSPQTGEAARKSVAMSVFPPNTTGQKSAAVRIAKSPGASHGPRRKVRSESSMDLGVVREVK